MAQLTNRDGSNKRDNIDATIERSTTAPEADGYRRKNWLVTRNNKLPNCK
jgi:hypothetical protein